MPILASLSPCTKSTIRCHPLTCSGRYIPAQPGEIRPSRLTSVISVITSPAPPIARLPRCTRCQSFGMPVVGPVLAHRGHHDPVGQHQIPQPVGREQRRRAADRAAPGARSALPACSANQRSTCATQRRVAKPQVLVGDAEAAGEQVEGELERLGVVVALGGLEPLEAGLRGPLQALHLRTPRRPRRPASASGTVASVRSAAASAIASSMASLVPEPTEKCAVWAASPSSTTLSQCQRAFRTVGKRRQMDRLASRRCPCSSSAKSRSR